MKMKMLFRVYLFLPIVIFLISNCGSKVPEWIEKGGAAFPKDSGSVLYGVGVTEPSPNPAMERAKADNRARQDISKQIETYVATFMKDFMEEHNDYFDPEATGSAEFTSYVAKSVSEATLVGSQIIDHYRDKDNNLWALSKLSVDDVLAQIKDKTQEALREKKRMVLEGRTNEMLEALDGELKKKREAQELGY